MKRETITRGQAVSIIALFVVGSSLVMGVSRMSKQDSWIAIFIAIAAMMPMIYIYSRLMHRYPGMSLFDICIDLFGRVLGRVVIALYVWYAFHLGSMVLRNYSEFIQITAFNRMPQTVSLMALIVLVIWVSRRGMEVLGRWSVIMLPVLIAIVAATVLLLIKDMHLSYLLPMGEYLSAVPRDAFDDFSFPYAETVLFLCLLNTVKPEDKPGRAWVTGVLVAGAVLLFGMFVRNALVLGFPMIDNVFPSYHTVRVIIAGSFLSRIENVVGANLLMAGFVKISVCLMVASRGFARLLGAEDHRPYVAPLGLAMVALASTIYNSLMEMFDFLLVYSWYALPFQVLLPVVLCIAAEIKFIVKEKRQEKKA